MLIATDLAERGFVTPRAPIHTTHELLCAASKYVGQSGQHARLLRWSAQTSLALATRGPSGAASQKAVTVRLRGAGSPGSPSHPVTSSAG